MAMDIEQNKEYFNVIKSMDTGIDFNKYFSNATKKSVEAFIDDTIHIYRNQRTAKEYADSYSYLLDLFLKEFEAMEIDFVESQLGYYSSIISDIENRGIEDPKFANSGVEILKAVKIVIKNISADKFYYSTKAKIKFLEDKQKELKEKPTVKTQTNTVKTVQFENKHNHIFKDNAFEVWQKMYNDFNITESSRTNIKFMFEVMLKDGLIHNTVTQVMYLQWIYDIYNIEVQRTSNYSKTQEREIIYHNAKQLYTT